ncbi:MAG: hypothetical protein R3297_06455, partial [Desulfobulbales bacterium]|nr:hypothetical protein [Desulfobulbales bacterium]
RSSAQKKEKMPMVCLMEKNNDGQYIDTETIDLAERDSETGEYVRNVIETYHPMTFGIQPVQHIFKEQD